ncbi:F-box/LRR-repeat protein At3g26922-like [Henckelia pumila]|uniref:F-box/LRR-repeat protein At3g26922-like n=1 Tax=Henckelia pumila TaxID=405737 RepID=UPI003C6E2318
MEDRISHLPDHVLHEVLSLLSEKDATKTGILSKHWNCVWNSFPILVFDEYEFSKNHKTVKANFCDSVDRTMRRRCESSIFTERLDIRIYRAQRDCKHLDSWIDCAVTLKLNQLILVIWNNQTRSEDGKQYYVLPPCVWNSKWLRVLKLEGCEFSGSINSIGIGFSLRKLKLHRVRIDESTFHQVISSCFHLEDLRITQCVGFKVLNVVGLEGIHTVRLHLFGDDQSVSIEAPGLRSLGFRGDSSSLERIIQACLLKKLKEINLVETDISDVDEFEKLIPEFLWLENLSLDKCKLKESFAVTSGRLMSFSLIECDDVTHIVFDTCCLNRFRYSGNCRLDITWIEASDEVEINHDLSFRCRDHLYGISFDKIAMYLVNLPLCKVLTLISNGKSKWIASRALDYLSCDIKRLRLKIMNRHAQIGRSCLLILEEFLRICRRPSSVLMELGTEESVVMRLDFLYQQEEMDKGQVIDGNCGCGGSSCWRCCLGELEISQNVHARRDRDARKLVEFFKDLEEVQISQSFHAMRGRDARNLVEYFKDNALRLKKISYVESEDDIHSQVF